MVVGTIIKFGGVAAGFILFGLFASRAAQVGIGTAANEIAESIGTFGSSLSTVGTGFSGLGTGIGSGISGLFAPFVSLASLFGLGNGNQATAQNNAAPSATQPRTTQRSSRSGRGGSRTSIMASIGGGRGGFSATRSQLGL